MYIIDLLKRIFSSSNVTILIYLILNIGIITAVVYYLYYIPLWQSLLIGLALYIASLIVALSPFGEWLVRVFNKCRRIKDENVINFLEPIFVEVKKEAKRQAPSIPDDVNIFINESSEPFAFATGRKTICISYGLLSRPEEEIRATLAHEFGHIAHKDTDVLLMVTVGNLIVQIILIGIRLILAFIQIIMAFVSLLMGGEHGLVGGIFTILYQIAWTVTMGLITWIWNTLGMLLVMRACRDNEYIADSFACSLGYADGLCSMLNAVDNAQYKGLFASLVSSHPSKEDRIARIKSNDLSEERTMTVNEVFQ